MKNHHPIILGLWPIAGITTLGVTKQNASATIRHAIDCGITQFDTAFSYGYDGESDRLLGDAIGSRRNEFRVIGKVGQRWTDSQDRVVDGRPEMLIADAETSLQRMGIDRFDMLMLHSPDPKVPIEVSAAAIASLRDRGLCDEIGVSNVSVEQYIAFRDAVGCDAIECPVNLLQSDASADLVTECGNDDCNVYAFWTLMKGLLAGKISRDHQFAKGDSRSGYAVFQGEQRETAHDLLDQLNDLANQCGCTIAQLSIGWVISQPKVTAALVGAHRPEQIGETAATKTLSPSVLDRIEEIVSPVRSIFQIQ